MYTKDPSSQKYTALEYMNIFGAIPENADEDKEIPFFTSHSSEGHRAVMLVEVQRTKASMRAGTGPME